MESASTLRNLIRRGSCRRRKRPHGGAANRPKSHEEPKPQQQDRILLRRLHRSHPHRRPTRADSTAVTPNSAPESTTANTLDLRDRHRSTLISAPELDFGTGEYTPKSATIYTKSFTGTGALHWTLHRILHRNLHCTKFCTNSSPSFE